MPRRTQRDRLFSIICASKSVRWRENSRPFLHRRTYFIRIAHLENRRAVIGKATAHARTAETSDSLNAGKRRFIIPPLGLYSPDYVAWCNCIRSCRCDRVGDVKVKYAFQPLCVSHNNVKENRASSFAPVRTTRRLYSTGTITIYHPFVFQTYWAVPPLYAVPLNICSPLCAFYAPVSAQRELTIIYKSKRRFFWHLFTVWPCSLRK